MEYIFIFIINYTIEMFMCCIFIVEERVVERVMSCKLEIDTIN